MLQKFIRHGIEISRHHLKGVYICSVGTSKKQGQSKLLPAEIICTLREDPGGEADTGDSESADFDAQLCGPICLGYGGSLATLYPWDPAACVIAAGIHNRLIHFPVRLGCNVFALGCTLQTLGHLSNIVGLGGRVIGVIGADHPKRPSAAELAKFLRRHPNASVITEDMQNATLETYERQLSLPQDSKYAFLMALHPRLGAASPVNMLGALDAEARNGVLQTIFDFVECSDAGKAKCLVVCHWPPGIRMDAVRDVVWSHIDILRRWRAPRGSSAQGGPQAAPEDSLSEGEQGRQDGGLSSDDEKVTSSGAEGKPRPRGGEAAAARAMAGPQWVLLDLATDNIVSTTEATDISVRLKEMVDRMKRHRNGSRTGLRAKEQLLLMPHFPSHALLLLKYAADRDEMSGVAPAPRRERAPPRRSRMEAICESNSSPQPEAGAGGMRELPADRQAAAEDGRRASPQVAFDAHREVPAPRGAPPAPNPLQESVAQGPPAAAGGMAAAAHAAPPGLDAPPGLEAPARVAAAPGRRPGVRPAAPASVAQLPLPPGQHGGPHLGGGGRAQGLGHAGSEDDRGQRPGFGEVGTQPRGALDSSGWAQQWRHQGGGHQGGSHQGGGHQGGGHQGGVHQGGGHQGGGHQGGGHQGGGHVGVVHQGGGHQGGVVHPGGGQRARGHTGGMHQRGGHQGGGYAADHQGGGYAADHQGGGYAADIHGPSAWAPPELSGDDGRRMPGGRGNPRRGPAAVAGGFAGRGPGMGAQQPSTRLSFDAPPELDIPFTPLQWAAQTPPAGRPCGARSDMAQDPPGTAQWVGGPTGHAPQGGHVLGDPDATAQARGGWGHGSRHAAISAGARHDPCAGGGGGAQRMPWAGARPPLETFQQEAFQQEAFQREAYQQEAYQQHLPPHGPPPQGSQPQAQTGAQTRGHQVFSF